MEYTKASLEHLTEEQFHHEKIDYLNELYRLQVEMKATNPAKVWRSHPEMRKRFDLLLDIDYARQDNRRAS